MGNQVRSFDLSDRSAIRLNGRDVRKLLHNLCSHEVNNREEWAGSEAFLLNAKGWILDHLSLFVGPGWIDLDASAGRAAGLLKHLDRYIIREDVKLADEGAGRALLHVGGAGTIPLVAGLLGEKFPVDPPEYAHGAAEFEDQPVRWRRQPRGLADGVDLFIPAASGAALLAALRERGAVGAGAADAERCRIRAGLPIVGREIGEMNLAQEMDRDPRAISFTKGCYLGQETVARLDAHGHVNKLLRGLTLGTDQPLETPAKVTLGGKDLGTMTSAAEPTGVEPEGDSDRGRTLGLAVLRTFGNAVGTEVIVETSSGPIPATVTPAFRG
jgi:hypothetical protein